MEAQIHNVSYVSTVENGKTQWNFKNVSGKKIQQSSVNRVFRNGGKTIGNTVLVSLDSVKYSLCRLPHLPVIHM